MKRKAKPSILLVDDLEANLTVLEALLAQMNCDIVLARSGNEALSELLKRDMAVMLLDVQMPEMDGFEVAKFAHENPATRHVPIIFLTAGTQTEKGMLHGYDMGAVDFLFKPFNPHVLRSKVQIFLDLYVNRQKLAALVEELEFKNKELDSFSYSVSHDLRAPLRAIDGFSSTLLTDYGDTLNKEGRHYLERIRAGTQRMSNLIDDLLNLSRVTRAQLQRESVNLTEIATNIVSTLRQRDPGRKVSVQVASNLSTVADKRLVTILLENLLGNAWKFTAKKPAAQINVDCKEEEEPITFRISDNGAGFDMAYAQKIFTPFQRFHQVTDFEGSGIGLAIVHRIVSRHGGHIWAEATVNDGATFYFTLGKT